MAAAWQAFYKIVSSRFIICSPRNLGADRIGKETYQLVHVPTTDADVAIVLIHAVAEVTNVGLTGRVLPGLVGSTALPETAVHTLRLGRRSLLGLSGSAGATTAEEATDGVADRGADCDTTINQVSGVFWWKKKRCI